MGNYTLRGAASTVLRFGAAPPRILGASLVVAAVTVAVKIAGLGKEMAVAWRFGAGDEIDALNLALTVPFLLINIVSTSFQSAFMPVIVQAQQQQPDIENNLIAEAFGAVVALFTIALLPLLLLAPVYLPLMSKGFAPDKIALTIQLLFLLAPLLVFTGISGLGGALLNTKDQFAVVAAAPLGTTLLTLLAVLFWTPVKIQLVATALTLGAVLECVVIGWALRQNGTPFRLKLTGLSPAVWTVLRQTLALCLGNLLMSVTTFFSVLMAARLVTGSVATLHYASKILALPMGITVTALGTVLSPYFARLRAQTDWAQLRLSVRTIVQWSFGILVPLTLILLWLAEPLTRLVFQRGAFSATNAAQVAQVVFYLALQLPFYVGGVLLARVMLALQCHREIFYISAANCLTSIVLTYWLSQRLGLSGIALATSLTYLQSFLLLYFLVTRRLSV